jgi:hypothetical protein
MQKGLLDPEQAFLLVDSSFLRADLSLVPRPRVGLRYSHSIVLGGLDEMSKTTRFTPFTSLMMRLDMAPRSS